MVGDIRQLSSQPPTQLAEERYINTVYLYGHLHLTIDQILFTGK